MATVPPQNAFDGLTADPPVRRKLAAGEFLFRAGDRVKALHVIATGRLKLVRTSVGGGEVTLHRAKEGESFAEPSLFSESYHCDAVAEVASEVLLYSKAQLLREFSDDPNRMLCLLRHLAVQIQGTRARAEILSLRAATDRAMGYLRLRAPLGSTSVTLDVPWKEVASEIGLTHEALYRALARLEREGRLRRDGQTVLLIDR